MPVGDALRDWVSPSAGRDRGRSDRCKTSVISLSDDHWPRMSKSRIYATSIPTVEMPWLCCRETGWGGSICVCNEQKRIRES
jgi:hypothetical protein